MAKVAFSFRLVPHIRFIDFARCPVRFCASEASGSRGPEPQPVYPRKARSPTPQESTFLDYIRVECRGGRGGDGFLSFLRLYANPFGGPDGGDGGNGGHVLFQADRKLKSLRGIKRICKAGAGENGHTKNRHGTNGDHLLVKVPIGTIFSCAKTKETVKELENDGERFVAARGGGGGRGNAYFLTNEVRAPLKAEAGAPGDVLPYDIHLRYIADVGLVGFPNAGKSTLLRAVSRAAPKVAAYPFTTLKPYVGTVDYDDFVQLTVADIPGLLPDAPLELSEELTPTCIHHIERCRCHFYVLDLSLSDPWLQLQELQDELEKFRPGSSKHPAAILGNKIDLPHSQNNLKSLLKRTDLPVFPISAKFRSGLKPLFSYMRRMRDEERQNSVK